MLYPYNGFIKLPDNACINKKFKTRKLLEEILIFGKESLGPEEFRAVGDISYADSGLPIPGYSGNWIGFSCRFSAPKDTEEQRRDTAIRKCEQIAQRVIWVTKAIDYFELKEDDYYIFSFVPECDSLEELKKSIMQFQDDFASRVDKAREAYLKHRDEAKIVKDLFKKGVAIDMIAAITILTPEKVKKYLEKSD